MDLTRNRFYFGISLIILLLSYAYADWNEDFYFKSILLREQISGFNDLQNQYLETIEAIQNLNSELIEDDQLIAELHNLKIQEKKTIFASMKTGS